MTRTRHSPGLTGIDVLGLAMLGCTILGLAVPGAVPGVLRNILIPAPSIQAAASRQANCLWLQARNHGFYGLQHQAVSGKATAREDELWQAFLNSTGEHECGATMTERDELMPALLASLPEADRHFMASNGEPGAQ